MPARKPPRMVYVPILGVSLPRDNKTYMADVHRLPCVVTGAHGVEAHHPKGLQWGTGMGQKAPDETAIPVCKTIHDEYHRIGVKSWEEKYGSHQSHLEKVWRQIGWKPQ